MGRVSVGSSCLAVNIFHLWWKVGFVEWIGHLGLEYWMVNREFQSRCFMRLLEAVWF